jgi:hypothetical protein
MLKTETIQTLEDIAQALAKRRMEAPAIFFLELSKPLAGLARELYSVTCGVQQALFGRELMPVITELLSSNEKIEQLIVRLERSSGQVK